MLLVAIILLPFIFTNPVFPILPWKTPCVFPVKVTYKKSAKKNAKTYTKNLTSKITVKNPTLKLSGATEVFTGKTATITATVKPASAKVTFKSSDDTVATVDAATGVVTGVKAGTATITATAKNGKKTVTAKQTITVKDEVAELTDVKQTASNAVTTTFNVDASKAFTKDDITVTAADGSNVLAVKSVEFAKDGKSATVTVFGNFVNGTTYKVTCKDKTVEFAAKVGAVSRVAINTASAAQNVETPISFSLFDADGIDVTPSVSVDTTCYVTITGTYSAASYDKASKASITMSNVKDEAEVTVTYNSNEKGAQDVTATQKIVCVDAAAVQGTKLFAAVDASDTVKVNNESGCAKFYLGLSDASVSVDENKSKDIYFCAKNGNDVLSYDSYEVESSNDDIASATVATGYDSAKFALISVVGNKVGTAQLNVKATKNGKDTFYTIPVSVTKPAEATRMTLEVTKSTMSDVEDGDYYGEVKPQLYDKDGNKVEGDFSFKITTETDATGLSFATPSEVKDASASGKDVTVKYYAANAKAKSYNIQVTGADKNTSKTFVRNISVTVKKLATIADYSKLSYQIELNRTTIDENPVDTSDDSVEAKLYATYNGLFAGYVREDGDGVTVGNKDASDDITSVKVVAKLGVKTFNPNTGLFATGDKVALGDVISGAAIKFDSVTSASAINWTSDGKAAPGESLDLAQTGTYTITYTLTKADGKTITPSNTFAVKNTVVVPTVTVTSRTADSLNTDDIIKCMKTNVDMNNKTSDYVSFDGIYATTDDTKSVVKYAIVYDNYGSKTWYFWVPVNATFKTE